LKNSPHGERQPGPVLWQDGGVVMEIIWKLSDMAGSATRTPQRDNPYQKGLTQKMVKDGKRCGGDLSELKQIKPKPTAVALCVSGRKPLNLRRSQSQSKSVKVSQSQSNQCARNFALASGFPLTRPAKINLRKGRGLVC